MACDESCGLWWVQRDFNADGKTDILWASSTGDVSIWLMKGASASSIVGLANVGTGWSIAGTADFNNDGTGGILWRNAAGDTALWSFYDLKVVLNKSLGNVPTNWSVADIADFDGDRYLDILWRSSSGDNAIWFMTKGGQSVSSIQSLATSPRTRASSGRQTSTATARATSCGGTLRATSRSG